MCADVLVIDDDHNMRHALRTLLEDDGHIVYEAPDGVSGIECMRRHTIPLVVLLDWRMPGMDGLEVLQTVADDAPLIHRHQFILLTALDENALSHLRDFPLDMPVTVMGKPFDIEDMLRLVDEASGKRSPDS